MNVEIVRLPSWRGGMLAAEYDRETDTARINSDAVARIRERFGEADARAFVACAIAHERFHREYPHAAETAAHAYVRATCGDDPARFAAALRS